MGDLITQVENLNLVKNTEKSLFALLANAQKSLEQGKTNDALGKLGAFSNQVEAQRGKKIAVADADALIAYAQRIMAAV